MRDLFEAIEQLSTLLAMRIERASRKRGWASKPVSRTGAASRGRLIHLVSTTVNLPQGPVATFVPRPEADDDQGWRIDIRRSDGVMRRSWADGLRVQKSGANFVLIYFGAVLSDESVEALLDDLCKPGPSGVALWVRKVWAIRFGRMPVELSDQLESLRDADRMDLIHGVLLRAVDQADALRQIGEIGKLPP